MQRGNEPPDREKLEKDGSYRIQTFKYCGEYWFWTKGRCIIWRFFKIRGTLNHKGDFPQEFPVFEHLLQQTVCGCYNSASPQGFPHSSVALHSIHLSSRAQILNIWVSPCEPQEILIYTQPISTNDLSWILQHSLRIPKNCLTQIFLGDLGPLDLKQAIISLIPTLKLGPSEQPLGKGRWPHSANSHHSNCSPTPLLLFLPSLHQKPRFPYEYYILKQTILFNNYFKTRPCFSCYYHGVIFGMWI